MIFFTCEALPIARHLSMAFFSVRSASLRNCSLISLLIIPHTILSFTRLSVRLPNLQSLALSLMTVRNVSNFSPGCCVLLKNKILTYVMFFIGRQYCLNFCLTVAILSFSSTLLNSDELYTCCAYGPAT